MAVGIPTEVVPGVTSATAVPASAGIPITYRGLASSVTIVTGHEDPRKARSAVDWDWLAAANGTLVILMGLGHLAAICDRLIAGGRAPDTPAAAIAAGTCPDERVVTASLSELADAVAVAQLDAPTLIVVGEVVRLRDLLSTVALVGPRELVTTAGRASTANSSPAPVRLEWAWPGVWREDLWQTDSPFG